MASLEGLPPLPKSLSGLNLLDYNKFQQSSSPYMSDHSASGGENNFSRSYSLSSDNGNFVTGRSHSTSMTISSENILGRRTTPPLRENQSYKQLSDMPSLSSARGSPVVGSSRISPHGSSRGSPVFKGSAPPIPPLRGTTPPTSMRGLTPPTPPPRQSQVNLFNGLEVSPLLPPRPGRLFTLDNQLATLRKEMFSLRQMDLSLLNQLWSLNEAIQEFRHMQEENAALSPPSPASCEDSDEFYSPQSGRGYQNLPNFSIPQFSSRLSSSSSDSSVEFGDV